MYPSPRNTLNASLWIGHGNLSPGSTTFLRLRVLFLTTCNVYLDFFQAPYMHMSKKKILQALNCLCMFSFPHIFLVSPYCEARKKPGSNCSWVGSEEASVVPASWQWKFRTRPVPAPFLSNPLPLMPPIILILLMLESA